MSEPVFKDHFSKGAGDYATFRPHYPAALFAFISSLPPARHTAWDCATGNGQAAVPLADYFAQVIATDASAEQIRHATPHSRVSYAVAPADASGIRGGSVDLVTVAQALHWLPLGAFVTEVRRVLVPRGVLAVWCYSMGQLDGPADAVLQHYYHETCRPYWAPERALVDDGYRSVPLPIDEVAAPPLAIELDWTLDQLVGYLRTWSATRNLAQAIGQDPVLSVREELRAHWGEPASHRRIRWPIHVRAGRVQEER